MWRRATIANVETLSDTQVWEYSLPTSGILGAVFLQLRATNGGTSNLDNTVEQSINSIQLVDGGRVMLDLSGAQAQMVSMLSSKASVRSVVSEGAGDGQTFQVLVPFGLKLYDNDVGLDLGTLRNPKLRVDFDLTNVRAVGGTGFVGGTGRISAFILINDGSDAPVPGQFVKSHELKQWTTAVSGDETTQAPVDAPWMRIIVRAHLAGNNPDDVLTDIKVSFDSGQFVAVDELTRWAADSLGPFLGFVPQFAFTLLRGDGESRDLRHGGIEAIAAQALLDTDTVNVASFESGNPVLNVNIGSLGTTQAAAGDIFLHATAQHPFMSMVWDFAGQGMLAVDQFDRGDIVLTQAVASAAASIVLQQLSTNRRAG